MEKSGFTGQERRLPWLVWAGGCGVRGAPGPRHRLAGRSRLPLPCPAVYPSLEWAAPPSWLQGLREGSELFPKWLAALPRLQLPVVQTASENAPYSL